MTLLLSLACYITEADVEQRWDEINGGVDSHDTDAATGFTLTGSIQVPSSSAYVPGPVQVGVAAFDISDGAVVHDPIVVQLVDAALPAGVSRPFEFQLDVSDLDDDWFYNVNAEWPDTETATLSLISWVDQNQDGQWSQGERLLGCNTEQVLVYVRGEMPPGDIFPAEGWYRLTLDLAPQAWTIADAYAIDGTDSLNATTNLLPNNNRELGLEVRGPASAMLGTVPTLALVNVAQVQDLIRSQAVADAAVLDTTTTINEGYAFGTLPVPEPGHLISDEGAGLVFATYVAAVFDDRDSDGTIDAYEFTGHASIWAPVPRYAVYTEAMGFRTAFTLSGLGWTPGYHVIQQEPDGDPELLGWDKLVVAMSPE